MKLLDPECFLTPCRRPKSNADAFPALGNYHEKTAGGKIDLAIDVLTCSIVSHSLPAATEQEKSIGKESVVWVGRGDLVLWQMGYFSLRPGSCARR